MCSLLDCAPSAIKPGTAVSIDAVVEKIVPVGTIGSATVTALAAGDLAFKASYDISGKLADLIAKFFPDIVDYETGSFSFSMTSSGGENWEVAVEVDGYSMSLEGTCTGEKRGVCTFDFGSDYGDTEIWYRRSTLYLQAIAHAYSLEVKLELTPSA